jgi:hypothetical protein
MPNLTANISPDSCLVDVLREEVWLQKSMSEVNFFFGSPSTLTFELNKLSFCFFVFASEQIRNFIPNGRYGNVTNAAEAHAPPRLADGGHRGHPPFRAGDGLGGRERGGQDRVCTSSGSDGRGVPAAACVRRLLGGPGPLPAAVAAVIIQIAVVVVIIEYVDDDGRSDAVGPVCPRGEATSPAAKLLSARY